MEVNAEKYEYDDWSKDADIRKLKVSKSWSSLFKRMMKDKKVEEINNLIQSKIKSDSTVYPPPDLLFLPYKRLRLPNVKVVILGQDPYHNCREYKGRCIPEAMGMAFSVPHGLPVPSSLRNIYNNMVKYKHLQTAPPTGNLEGLMKQGVLLINTVMTVEKNKPNGHAKYWRWFSDKIIQYISDKCDYVVFMLWGRLAINKLHLINESKHFVIKSSHPSGYSCVRPCGIYPCFMGVDHFGIANKRLLEIGEKPIKFDKAFKYKK